MNIAININKQTLTALPDGPLVAASVGVVTCTAEFDPSWEGFTRTLVFACPGLSRSVLWTGGEMVVPWEVLAQPGPLFISALGVQDGLRRPTAVMQEPLSIRPSGLLTGGAPGEFSDPLWSQTLAEVQRLREEAERAAEAAIRAAEAAEALVGQRPGGENGAVQWGEILDKPFDYRVDDVLYMGQLGSQIPWNGTYRDIATSVTLVDGELYLVRWNGETYVRSCHGGLGNPDRVDGVTEPFAIVPIEGGLRIYGYTGEELRLTIAGVTVTKRLDEAFLEGQLQGVPIIREASGVEIALADSAAQPIQALTVFGESIQDGEPAPDAPVEIVSIGDSGSLTVTVSDGSGLSRWAEISSALPLRRVPVKSGGNVTIGGQQYVADTLEFLANGTAQIVKRVKVLSGAENVVSYFPRADQMEQFNRSYVISSVVSDFAPKDRYTGFLCTHNPAAGGTIITYDPNSVYYSTTDKRFTFMFQRGDLRFTTREEALQWAETAGVTYLYATTDIQRIPLTAREAAELGTLQTCKPVTTVTNDGNAPMVLAYVADTKTYVDNKFAAMGGLEPVARTEKMTQPVGVDEQGQLWTEPGSGVHGVGFEGVTLEYGVAIEGFEEEKGEVL